MFCPLLLECLRFIEKLAHQILQKCCQPEIQHFEIIVFTVFIRTSGVLLQGKTSLSLKPNIDILDFQFVKQNFEISISQDSPFKVLNLDKCLNYYTKF